MPGSSFWSEHTEVNFTHGANSGSEYGWADGYAVLHNKNNFISTHQSGRKYEPNENCEFEKSPLCLTPVSCSLNILIYLFLPVPSLFWKASFTSAVFRVQTLFCFLQIFFSVYAHVHIRNHQHSFSDNP